MLIKFIFAILFLSGPMAFANGTFAKHEANLLQVLGKIHGDERSIRELIEEKNKATDPAKIHEIATEIKKLLKDRKENIIKYNKEYSHVEYEHPGEMDSPKSGKKEDEKGGHEGGDKKEGAPEKHKVRYKRFDEKSIKEFEDEVNKLLSDVYGNVKKKYNQ